MSRPVAALVLLLLPALLAPAHAQSPTTFAVNVLSARDLGCSPDREGGPDLRVKVLLNEQPLLVTPVGVDDDELVFAARVDGTALLPAKLTIVVEEGQPPVQGYGVLLPCDVAPGEGEWLNVTYSGGAAERIVSRGDGPNAAEVVLIVGTGAPASPSAAVVGVSGTSANLLWDRARTTPTGVRIALGNGGDDLATLPADATGATLTGLCDNHDYVVRVIRETAPWDLGSADVAFSTSNLPPEAPRVLRADGSAANLTVAWESRTLHDVGRYEVHVGPDAGFAVTADTLRGTAPASRTQATGTLDLARREGDAYVRVRTVDNVGATAVSDAFAIGAPPIAATTPAPTDPCDVRVEAPGATAVPRPTRATPTPATPTTGTPPPTGATPPASPAPTAAATPPGATPPAASPTNTVGAPTPPAGDEGEDEGQDAPLGAWPALAALALAALAVGLRRRR